MLAQTEYASKSEVRDCFEGNPVPTSPLVAEPVHWRFPHCLHWMVLKGRGSRQNQRNPPVSDACEHTTQMGPGASAFPGLGV